MLGGELDTDGADAWAPLAPLPEAERADPTKLRERIQGAGIAGTSCGGCCTNVGAGAPCKPEFGFACGCSAMTVGEGCGAVADGCNGAATTAGSGRIQELGRNNPARSQLVPRTSST